MSYPHRPITPAAALRQAAPARPWTVTPNGRPGHAKLKLPDETLELEPAKTSDWVRLKFKAGLGVSVTGIAQFRIMQTAPEVSLYMTPI